MTLSRKEQDLLEDLAFQVRSLKEEIKSLRRDLFERKSDDELAARLEKTMQ